MFGFEQLTTGVDGERSVLINKDISSLKDVKWLGSVVTRSGNFVWYRDMKDWGTYLE